MARTINEFPMELVELVLKEVQSQARVNRDASFLNTLTVCRRWYGIGEAMLWTDIVLNPSQIVRFAAQYTLPVNFRLKFGHPQSLKKTLSLTINYADTSSLEECLESLRDLADRVGYMERLQSISIRVQSHRCFKSNCRLQSREIKALLKALPPSIRHIELDDHCSHRLPVPVAVSEEDHLCPLVAKILPQLENFRFSCSRFCEAMLPQGPSVSEFGPISDPERNVHAGKFIINAVGAALVGYPARCRSYEGSSIPNRRPFLDSGSFVLRMESAMAKRTFCNMQDYMFIDINDHTQANLRTYPTILSRQYGSQQMIRKYPIVAIGEIEGVRCWDTAGNIYEVETSNHDVADLLERQVWIDTEHGHRLPVSYIKQNSRFEGIALRLFSFDGCSKYIAELLPSYIHAKEIKEGRILLLPTTTNDMHDTTPVERDLTQKEMRREERRKAIERGEDVGEDPDSDSEIDSGSDGELDEDDHHADELLSPGTSNEDDDDDDHDYVDDEESDDDSEGYPY